jgi:hypothetical protein
MIEKGRHLNIPHNHRYCKFCLMRNVYIVEDEYHMFMQCPLYNTLRHDLFIPQWLNQIETVRLFNMLMADENDKHIFLIAKFLSECNKVRRQFNITQHL